MSINELVSSAKNGDKVALYNLIAVLKPIRKSLISKFSKFDSEDLDQDLILVLIECVDSFLEGECSFQWYVREKSRYFCLDLAKEMGCLSLDEVDDNGISFMDMIDSGEVLEDLVFDFNLREKVLLEVSRLEPKVRFVIYFHFFKEFSLKEIAEKMNVSVSTVFRLKEKGVKVLKKSLGEISKEVFYDN